ncbi:MAG: hypothetical protein AAFV28_13025 [Cyanobacteria bacterium J06635_13]
MLNIDRPQLTSEQIASISEYRHKWRKIAANSKPIDQDLAVIAINNSYSFLSLPQPNVVFFSEPKEAIHYINREIDSSWGKFEKSTLGNAVASKLWSELIGNFNSQIQGEIFEHLQGDLDCGLADSKANEIVNYFGWNRIFTLVWTNASSLMLSSEQDSQIDDNVKNLMRIFLDAGFLFSRYAFPPLWTIQKNAVEYIFHNLTNQDNLDHSLNQGYQIVFSGRFSRNTQAKYQLPVCQISCATSNVIVPSVTADYAYYINYLHEVLDCSLDSSKWQVFYDLITTCGWIFPYQKTALVCDRDPNN